MQGRDMILTMIGLLVLSGCGGGAGSMGSGAGDTTPGERDHAAQPVTRIRDILEDPDRFLGKTVMIEGEYRGWEPDPQDPQALMGPPVTRSDWAIQDIGKPAQVVGMVRKSEAKGRLYLQSQAR